MGVQFLGREDLLEEGVATYSSILAWRTPWTEEPGRLWSIGSQRVGYDWSYLAHTHTMSIHLITIPLAGHSYGSHVAVIWTHCMFFFIQSAFTEHLVCARCLVKCWVKNMAALKDLLKTASTRNKSLLNMYACVWGGSGFGFWICIKCLFFLLFPKLFPDLCLDLLELRVLWGKKNAVLAKNSYFKYGFIDFLKTEALKGLIHG